ncbi:hypothetical protein IIZ77_01915 [Candidatus Saccharibacteria bacterium]|nr:hypothetical protein [Candidatus Saccharibacteria bacterium]
MSDLFTEQQEREQGHGRRHKSEQIGNPDLLAELVRNLNAGTSTNKTEKEEPHPSETYAVYWRLCLAVVNAAGEVAGKDKMLINFRDPQKRHSVKDVVQKSFNGEKSAIADKRNQNIRIFFTRVDDLNEYAVEHGSDQVCGMELMGMLVDASIRDKFKHHIKKHLESNHPPFALDELPGKDFRKTKTARA